jgi:hypothetical protein
MPEQPDSNTRLTEALVLRWFLPVMVDAEYAPLVWVDPARRQDVLALEHRALAVGEQITELTPPEVLAVYGQTVTQWVYHFGQDVIAFFLSVQVDAPAFAHASLDLKALQVQFVLGFNVAQKATVALLQAIVKSRSLLLHFSAVPDWVPQMPPLSSGRSRRTGHEDEILHLVRSSIPIGFTAEAMTRLQMMLDRLPRRP